MFFAPGQREYCVVLSNVGAKKRAFDYLLDKPSGFAVRQSAVVGE